MTANDTSRWHVFLVTPCLWTEVAFEFALMPVTINFRLAVIFSALLFRLVRGAVFPFVVGSRLLQYENDVVRDRLFAQEFHKSV